MSDANNQLNKFGKSFWVSLKIDFCFKQDTFNMRYSKNYGDELIDKNSPKFVDGMRFDPGSFQVHGHQLLGEGHWLSLE